MTNVHQFPTKVRRPKLVDQRKQPLMTMLISAQARYVRSHADTIVNGPTVEIITLADIYDPLFDCILHLGGFRVPVFGKDPAAGYDYRFHDCVSIFMLALGYEDELGYRLPVNHYPAAGSEGRWVVQYMDKLERGRNQYIISEDINNAVIEARKMAIPPKLYSTVPFKLKSELPVETEKGPCDRRVLKLKMGRQAFATSYSRVTTA